jgi:hypothetical protein
MFDDFSQGIAERWTQTCLGPGSVQVVDEKLRMCLPAVPRGQYADAQIDDYDSLPRSAFPWRPPLRMEVRARSSHPAATASSSDETTGILRGTAGFGFWNYPFSVRGDILMLPESVWFFYASPPSNMALVPGLPGWGWKAQVVHSMRAETVVATVPMALSATWARLTGDSSHAARWMQRLSGAQEALLDVDMTDWHTYRLEWRGGDALFWVNNRLVLRAPHPPTRPLGFVAWIDNQYAVATPRGTLRFGSVATDPEWLELDYIKIEPL